jgi:hypothetical protein
MITTKQGLERKIGGAILDFKAKGSLKNRLKRLFS